MKSAIIFIDGSNFYHNSKGIRLIPKMIDFKKLCEFICKELSYRWKLTYYYNAIPDIRDSEEVYYKHIKFLNELNALEKFVVKTRKLQKRSNKELQEAKRLLIKELDFCEECKPKVVQHCMECIGDFNKKEKGIDVMIAVAMIDSVLKGECDCCILISGDADFIPALNLVKRNKKEAIVCSVNFGFASELRKTQKFIILKKSDIEDNCYKTV